MLLQPLPQYGRAAIIFEYENSRLLKDVIAAMDAVNKAALPNLLGSLRSYELTDAEIEAADKVRQQVLGKSELEPRQLLTGNLLPDVSIDAPRENWTSCAAST